MAKPIGKKRGRPCIRLADIQPKWEVRLRRAGNPQEITSGFEVSEQSMPWTDREPSGRKTRPKKIIYGESCEHWSTQERNSALSDLKEAAANESIVLSADWHRYLEYVNVIAEELSPTDKGAAFKNLALQDARSRHDSEPSQFPAELGTPAEFKERLAGHEFEIRTRFNRREQVIAIRVYQLPPDEYENLDPSEEPPGHWEGLKWIPDPE